jgi:hypothetical protein
MKSGILRHRFRQLLFCFLLVGMVLFGGFTAIFAQEPSSLWIHSTVAEPVGLSMETTRWQTIQGNLYAFTIVDEKIKVFTMQDQTLKEAGLLQSQDMEITAYQLKDVDGDGIPEVLAGTADPGMLYLYKYQNGRWESLDYGKYVWSSITKIIAGNFSGLTGMDILVQNKEGFLFLFHKSDQALDLIWKSPNPFRPFENALAYDLDNDTKDEIVVTYQKSGIAVLKLINQSIVTVWENYPWGKILALSAGDWDDDGRQEILFSTSQKLVYLLSASSKGYFFKAQLANYNYIIEQSALLKIANQKYWVATDTAGKLHAIKLAKTIKQWQEVACFTAGRANQLVNIDSEELFLWTVTQQALFYHFYDLTSFKLEFNGQLYDVKPGIICLGNQIYLSPRSLAIPGGGLEIAEQKNNIRFTHALNTLEINKLNPSTALLNGERIDHNTANNILSRNGEIYIPLQNYQNIFDMPVSIDFTSKTITLP